MHGMGRFVCKTAEDEDDVLLPLAFGPDGKTLVHARDMPSGLACGCTCPGCGARLEAHHPGPERPGRRHQRHHFQHSGVRACAVGLESAIHLKAKEFLLASDQLRLPDGHARVPGMSMALSELDDDLQAVCIGECVDLGGQAAAGTPGAHTRHTAGLPQNRSDSLLADRLNAS